MKTFTILLLLGMSVISVAQNFSDKTNTIVVSYKQPVVASTLPVVSWTSPRIETSLSTEITINIDAEVRTDLPLKELKLVLVSGGAKGEKKIAVGENEFTKSIKQNIHLQEGENTITLVAENSKGGRVESKRVVVMGKGDLLDANRKDIALIFATDNYDHWTDLSNPLNDAHTIACILK